MSDLVEDYQSFFMAELEGLQDTFRDRLREFPDHSPLHHLLHLGLDPPVSPELVNSCHENVLRSLRQQSVKDAQKLTEKSPSMRQIERLRDQCIADINQKWAAWNDLTFTLILLSFSEDVVTFLETWEVSSSLDRRIRDFSVLCEKTMDELDQWEKLQFENDAASSAFEALERREKLRERLESIKNDVLAELIPLRTSLGSLEAEKEETSLMKSQLTARLDQVQEELKGVLRQKRDLEQEISAKKLSLDEEVQTLKEHYRGTVLGNLTAYVEKSISDMGAMVDEACKGSDALFMQIKNSVEDSY